MEQIKVGVGVIVRKNGKVLIGRRTHAHGADTWQLIGGHLEFGESVAACAERETNEETGLTITNISQPAYTEDIFPEANQHYITLFVVADWESGEPERREPEKCAEWRWCEWEQLPRPLFLPIEHLIAQGFHPFGS